jgi:hypothetical protein
MPVTIFDQSDSGWQLGGDAGRLVFQKLMASGKPLGDVVEGRMYRGVLTGLNESFIIDQATRDRIIGIDPTCTDLIKPMLRGEDLRPWHQENEGRWLLGLPNHWTRTTFGAGLSEQDAWNALTQKHSGIAHHLAKFEEAARKRQDKGEYWWELRPCEYYAEFDKPKIFWPDITKFPRFSWDDQGLYLGNTGYIAVTDQPWILGYLASRCAWFLISQIAIGLGERAGVMRYRLIDQYMRPLPVPDAPTAEREIIGALAMQITEQAKARYTLHRRAQRRILGDFGGPGAKLNQKLTAWWDLDFPAFRDQIRKAFKREIAVRERDDWQEWLDLQRTTHREHTEAIIRLETQLNERVYNLFNLTRDEITLIEESTKYRYGEV